MSNFGRIAFARSQAPSSRQRQSKVSEGNASSHHSEGIVFHRVASVLVCIVLVFACDDDTKLRPDGEELTQACAELRVDSANMCWPSSPLNIYLVNDGELDAPAFTLGIYAGTAEEPGELLESIIVQGVPKGDYLLVDSKRGYDDGSDLIFRVDVEQQVPECNEENNELALNLRRSCWD